MNRFGDPRYPRVFAQQCRDHLRSGQRIPLDLMLDMQAAGTDPADIAYVESLVINPHED